MINSDIWVQDAEKEPKYPYLGLGKHYGTIVLFTAPLTGTVVGRASGHRVVGYWADNWDEDGTSTFHGTVTLSNG